MSFYLKNPTTEQVGWWTGAELVERAMNDAAKGEPDVIYAQLGRLVEIVGAMLDDLNHDRSNVLEIVGIYDLEHTNEEYTHGKP